MSDERKGMELTDWLDRFIRDAQYSIERGKQFHFGDTAIVLLREISQKLQQKPKIDDMEKYVEGKTEELFKMQGYYIRSGCEKFITQIISDVGGGIK